MEIKYRLGSFICILVLVFVSASQSAHAQNDQLNSMKFIRRLVQTDIDNIIKPTIFNQFLPNERIAAQNITVDVVLDTNILRVRAFRIDEKQRIEISTGFLALISQLIDANIVAIHFDKQSTLGNYYIDISKYITSYDSQLRNEPNPHWPDPFYKFSAITEDAYNNFHATTQYDEIFSLSMRIVLSYILSHEFAHHVLGHLTSKRPNNLDESRRNEDEADDFSIRVNWMLGNNPLLVTNYFLLFSMVEGGLHTGTHAPSACRLEKFLDAGIKFTESKMKYQNERLTDQIISNYKKLKEFQKILVEKCEKGEALTDTTMPGLW